MPIQEFALNSTGTQRVQIFQERSGEKTIFILVNNAIVGSIARREELQAGKQLALKSGSLLFIQQTNEGYQVMCDGQPLRLMEPAEIDAVSNVKGKQGVSTWDGRGTKLISVTPCNEQGQNYRVLFSVWMNMPLIPLERHLIGNYTLTSFSSTGSRMRTEYSYQDLGTSRLKFQEVLFAYFLYWVLGPVVLFGPALVVFVVLLRYTPLFSPPFWLFFIVLLIPLLLASVFLGSFLYEKWERGSYKGL